jgi:hypothetical protein
LEIEDQFPDRSVRVRDRGECVCRRGHEACGAVPVAAAEEDELGDCACGALGVLHVRLGEIEGKEGIRTMASTASWRVVAQVVMDHVTSTDCP